MLDLLPRRLALTALCLSLLCTKSSDAPFVQPTASPACKARTKAHTPFLATRMFAVQAMRVAADGAVQEMSGTIPYMAYEIFAKLICGTAEGEGSSPAAA